MAHEEVWGERHWEPQDLPQPTEVIHLQLETWQQDGYWFEELMDAAEPERADPLDTGLIERPL